MYAFIKSNIQQFPAISIGRFHFISPSDNTYDFIGKRSDLPILIQDSVVVAENLYSHGKMTISLILTEEGLLIEYEPSDPSQDSWYVWLEEITINVRQR
jgi:hypothetical protein